MKKQILYKIADSLKNIEVIETAHSETRKTSRCFGIAKGEFYYLKNFDEDNEEIAS